MKAQYENVLITARYSNEPLSNVFKSLHKEYGIRLSYDSYSIADVKCSGTFENAELKTVLDNILLPAGFAYRFIGKTVVIYPESGKVVNVLPDSVQNFRWRGQIRDSETGEPLPFAVIRIRGTWIGTTANSLGQFELNLVSDTCTAIINYIGYEELVTHIDFRSIGQRRQRLDLTPRRFILPAAVIEEKGLPVVNVEDDAGLASVNPSDISIIATGGEADVMRSVQLLPGIVATNENSAGLIIRGSDPDQTLVSFDDFTIYHLDHFYGTFSALNKNAVKSIRVHKGAMDARLGGRISGVVEVTGKEGNMYKPSATIDVGALSASVFVETPIGQQEKASLMIAARRSYTDLLYSSTYRKQFNTVYSASIPTDPDENADEFSKSSAPDFYFGDFTAKLTVRPSPDDVIQLSGYAGRDNLSLAYKGVLSNERFDVSYNDENQWGSTGAGIRWSHDFSSAWKSLATAGWSRYQSNLFAQDTIVDHLLLTTTSSYRNTSQGLNDLSGRAELSCTTKKNITTFGLQSNFISIQRQTRIEQSADTLNTRGAVQTFYLQTEHTSDKLKWTPGIRINYYGITKKIYPEVRLNGRWRWNEKITLKASAGRVYQFIHKVETQSLYLNNPDQWELSSPTSVPVLRSDQLCFGGIWKTKNWIIDIEAYYKWNFGSFEYLGPYAGKKENALLTENLLTGNGRAGGIDFFLQKEIRSHRIWLSYSLLKAYNNFNIPEKIRLSELFDQRHEIKAGYELKLDHWNAGVVWYFGTGRPYTPYLGSYQLDLIGGNNTTIPVFGDLNSSRLPSYHRLDLSVGYKFRWGKADTKISISIFNVYNRTNVRDIQYLSVSGADNNPVIAQRNVLMQGFLPSFNFKITI